MLGVRIRVEIRVEMMRQVRKNGKIVRGGGGGGG